MPIDDRLADLRALAEDAAATVLPLDLAAHEAALAREAEAELEARRQASSPTDERLETAREVSRYMQQMRRRWEQQNRRR